jgi:hypothetical protein
VTTDPPPSGLARRIVAWGWGVGGTVAVLGEGVIRVATVSADALDAGLATEQWLFAAVWVPAMAYGEGWRGFHQRFAPRVVVRARVLGQRGGWALLAAPLFVMGLVGATPRRMVANWALTLGIVVAVLSIRAMPLGWRGVIDAGVVAGLGAGALSVLWHAARAAGGVWPGVDPELPGSDVAPRDSLR